MLTPDEISQRRFLVSLRGYDRDEVSTFLAEVAAEVRTLRGRVAELEAEVQTARGSAEQASSDEPHAALRSLGEETTRILVAAEESARSIESRATAAAREAVETAERDARETTERAGRQAARTIAEAERRRDAVAAEIDQLARERDDFVAGLRASIQAVAAVVGGLEQDPVQVPVAPVVTSREGEPSHADDTDPVLLPDADDEGVPTWDAADAAPDAAEVADAAPTADGARAGVAPTAADADDEAEDGHEALAPAPAVDPDQAPGPTATPTATPDAHDLDDHDLSVDGAAATAPDEEEPADTAARADEAGADEAPAAEAVDESPAVEARRDATVGTTREEMSRRCKRGLQEIQNEVLASIREHGRGASLDDLLPAEAELDELGELGAEHLAGVYRGALDDAAAEVGGEAPTELVDGARVQAAVATFRAVLSHEVTSALRATLRAGLEADEPEPQLSERVGEVFRDLRGPVLESVVEEHLQRTYGHGLLDAWEQLGVEEVRWRAGDEARCPENRCRTNGAEGAVALGRDFPSGDRVPPAHPGCTCVVVPG